MYVGNKKFKYDYNIDGTPYFKDITSDCYSFLNYQSIWDISKGRNVEFVLRFDTNQDTQTSLSIGAIASLMWIRKIKTTHPIFDKIISGIVLNADELVVSLKNIPEYSNVRYLMLVASLIRYISDIYNGSKFYNIVLYYLKLRDDPRLNNIDKISLLNAAHIMNASSIHDGHGMFRPNCKTMKLCTSKHVNDYFEQFELGRNVSIDDYFSHNIGNVDLTEFINLMEKGLYVEAFALEGIYDNKK